MSWALPKEVFAFLARHLPPDATVLELGSGDGTGLLVENYARVFSVEHDPEWLGKHGATYIHAPIVDGWYDPAAIKAGLPDRYHCLIVDGPPGHIGRAGLLDHLDLFQRVPIVVDDVNRRAEFELAVRLAKHYGESLSVHYLTSGRAFATTGWGYL